jgi:hypothetical protein
VPLQEKPKNNADKQMLWRTPGPENKQQGEGKPLALLNAEALFFC